MPISGINSVNKIYFIFLLCMLVFMFFFSTNSYAKNEKFNISVLRESIEKNGVHDAGADLYDNNENINYFLGKVAEGDVEWLSIAEELYFTSHASLKESIIESISSALDSKPENVLKLKRIELKNLCDGGDIDTNPNYDIAKSSIAIKKRISRIEKISNKYLKEEKSICLNGLREYQAIINNFPAK